MTRAVEYLDRLAGESAGELSLQRELADAYGKMGDAQGNPYLANLGDGAGAMRSYQKAFKLHSALAAANPHDLTLQRNLAADHVRIADMLWADGQYPDALEHCRVAMGVYEGLASEDTAMQLDDRFSVTRTLNRMGLIQLSAGNLADSLQLYQRSLSLASDLTVAAPQNVTYRRAFAVAALKIGDVVDRMHDYQSGVRRLQSVGTPSPPIVAGESGQRRPAPHVCVRARASRDRSPEASSVGRSRGGEPRDARGLSDAGKGRS